jgi:hypothetical protein
MRPINALELYGRIKGEWDKTDQPLTRRGLPGADDLTNQGLLGALSLPALANAVAPVGEYEDGSMGLAWPQIIAGPADAWKRMVDTSYASPRLDDAQTGQMSRDSFDAAGLAMTGGLGAAGVGMVDNALGSAGGRLAKGAADLPMDLASRMARAKEMGFDTENVWYHGTRYDFDEFKPSNRGVMGPGVYLGDQKTASQYTNRGNGISYQDSTGDRVLPVVVRGNFASDRMLSEATKKHFVGDQFYGEAQRLAADDLKSQGYAGILDAKNNISTVFDPRNIRSVNAAFDPAMSDSANLLAANAKTGAAVPLATNALERAGADLPMDLASRMARAREMGFDTDNVLYHGTRTPGFDAFDSAHYGANFNWSKQGVHLTPDPMEANIYAGSEGAVYPVFIRRGNEASIDGRFMDVGPFHRELQRLKDAGVDTVVPSRSEVVSFDPRNIRSVNAAFDPALSDSANLLAANAKTGAAVPLATNALERQPQGIRAYHGSPHDFDRFSLDKIGTGEGAQAYGHGLYFADSEDVARTYRDNLTPVDYKLGNQPLAPQEPSDFAARRALQNFGPNIDDAIAKAKAAVDGGHPADVSEWGPALQKLEEWKQSGQYSYDKSGRLYEVNIKANPEDFLDWDKPLSQQSEAVRSMFEAIVDPQRQKYPNFDPKGETLYRWAEGGRLAKSSDDLAANVGGESALSRLREAGIPGIRYLDGMSRDGGAGTSNYVVFDDALIDILRKYANAPTGAAIPAGMEASQDDNQALIKYLRSVGLL